MAWLTERAPAAEDVNRCVSCGLCLPACPTFRLTGDEGASPRGRLAAIAAVAAGTADLDDRFEEVMGFCLQCRACESICPSMVPFGRIKEGARAELTVQRPDRSNISHRLLFGRAIAVRPLVHAATTALALLQRSGGGLLEHGPGLQLQGTRELPVRPRSLVGSSWDPIGTPVGTVALLAGCVMDAWFSDVHRALIQVLRTAGYRVEVPEGQVCCGALAAHEGATYDASRLAARNAAAFASFSTIVVDAAGCGAHMKAHDDWAPGAAAVAAKTLDATEMVAGLIDAGALPTLPPTAETVAMQDPCHLIHAQRIALEPRRVVAAAGYEPIDIDPQALCCGAAGSYSLSYPETTAELGVRKAEQVAMTGAVVVASANPGCEMQLRRHLPEGFVIRHPVELYWEALGAAAV